MPAGISQVSPGIYQISWEIPIEVDPINLYFIAGNLPTLIDTGPMVPGGMELVSSRLVQVGFDVKNLAQIIVTHGHVDHYGLAIQLRQVSGAKLLIHPLEQQQIAEFHRLDTKLGSYYWPYLRKWGFSAEHLAQMDKFWLQMAQFSCGSVDEVELLQDGQIVKAGDSNLEVIHCPGHSSGLVCLFQRESSTLFSSDLVLDRITPNPDLYIPEREGQISGLTDYLSSLDKVAAYQVECCLPGHGKVITHHRQRIEEIKQSYRERKLYFNQLLNGKSLNPMQLAQMFLGDGNRDLNGGNMFFALREVMGYLTELQADCTVQVVEQGGVAYYQLISKPQP